MKDTTGNALTVELLEVDGSWHVVLEREGARRELEGLDELIRYLSGLAAAGATKPARGLR